MSLEAHSFSKPSRKRHSKSVSVQRPTDKQEMTPFVPYGPKKEPNGRGSPGRLRRGATYDGRVAGSGARTFAGPEIRESSLDNLFRSVT